MLGIILTLLAVFFVVCVAFYFSDHPGPRSRSTDPLFFHEPGRSKNRQPSR
jgi:hypothetical protein